MTSRNYTEYSGAEEWLRETYPHLHHIWTQSFNSPSLDMFNLELKCKICELKPSTGIHYGVKMCEADKQFLKRSFHYQIVYSPCDKEDIGVCAPRPRGWCQMCRLRKCLSFPVNISLIRIGNKASKVKKEAPPQISITVIPPPLFETQDVPTPEYEIKNLPTFDFFQYREPTPMSGFSLSSKIDLIEDCEPLDLSRKRKHCAVDNDWFSDELLFTSFSPENMFLPPSKPLDLSPYSSTGDQSQLTDFFLHPGLDPVTRRTPSPVLEASQSLYKVSVYSTLLGDALSRIQSSMSMSNSLVNLSSVSDVLPVNLSSLSDVLQDNDK